MNELDHLNNLYFDWQDATEVAIQAQHDVIVFMQQYLHGKQEAPPLRMQTTADELWRRATRRQADLAEFLHTRLHIAAAA